MIHAAKLGRAGERSNKFPKSGGGAGQLKIQNAKLTKAREARLPVLIFDF
jgi:hypothetical protein